MNKLTQEQANLAVELKYCDETSSILAMVEAVCAYTVEVNPAAEAMAEELNKSFGEWLLLGAGKPAAEWVRENYKPGMAGKDWIKAAMAAGFQVPK